jgi:hypothetical protein
MSRRRERREASFRRGRPSRQPYDAVLIVCEGAKTEPHYFEAMRKELRLSSANIVICREQCGSAPITVVDFAIKEAKKTGGYQRVFCVIDRDCHTDYAAALDKVRRARIADCRFEPIPSVPCFEFWLLLHFEETTRPFVPEGNKSACDTVVRSLRAYLPQYEKGTKDTFRRTYTSVDTAIKRAHLLEGRQRQAGTDNPSTSVHKLVTYLQALLSATK